MGVTREEIESIAARIAKVEAEIPGKAATDPEFHDTLKANPPATIEKSSGFPEGLLKDIDIRIFEAAPGSIGLVIPPDARQLEDKLAEEQREAVAGGVGVAGALLATAAVGPAALAAAVFVRSQVSNPGGWGDLRFISPSRALSPAWAPPQFQESDQ